ncbi:MAG: amidohydrolase [Candidatus Kryptoniota bacterium]
MKTDLIIMNGTFMTLDNRMPTAQAVAVMNGKIVGVGTNNEILSHFYSEKTIDIKGAFATPGLIDGHGHIVELGTSMSTLNLTAAESPEAIAAEVREEAQRVQPGTWIKGRGWDQNLWLRKSFPDHSILDEAAPDNYVFLVRIDGHAVWVNKKVMDFAGINRATPSPAGGEIVRDKNGNPTGVFLDAAINLIASKIPAPSDAEVESAILRAIDTCARYGLTEVHDAGINWQTLNVYKKLAAEGKLKVRIYAMYSGSDSTLLQVLKAGPILGYKDHFTLRSVKVYMDGALGSRGAALVQSYSDDPGNYGFTEMSEKDLENITIASLANGFQVCTHAIGDRANHIVLNAYEKAMEVSGVHDARLRVEHAQVLLNEDIQRFCRLGVIPSMQPTHCTSDMYWAESRLGPERIKYAYAWRSLLKSGCIIIGGSDFPVESPDPRLGIYAAITRKNLNGIPENFNDALKYFQLTPDAAKDSSYFNNGFFSNQKMTLDEAIKAFTIWPSYGAFQENVNGTVSVGKFADFTIFKRDFRALPANEIPHDEILATFVGGKMVYVNPSLSEWRMK